MRSAGAAPGARPWRLGAALDWPLGLARLEYRRVLLGRIGLTLALWTLAVSLLTERAPLVRSSLAAAQQVERGLWRQSSWTAILFVLLPLVLVRAASLAQRWRAGEGDWIGSRPIGKGAALWTSFLGVSAAALTLLLLCLAWVEWRSPAGQPTFERLGGDALETVRRVPAGAALEFVPELGARPEEGDQIRVRALASMLEPAQASTPRDASDSSGARAPGSQARVVLTRAGHESAGRARRLLGRDWLSATVPAGEGALRVRVETLAGAPLLWLSPGSVELWRPIASEAAASLRLCAHTAWALLAGLALALGLGFWLSPITAAAAVLALGLAASWLPGGTRRVPGSDLAALLETIGQGRVPREPSAALGLVALAAVALGLCLARLGLRSWRHAS